jgi:hypothetical protein
MGSIYTAVNTCFTAGSFNILSEIHAAVIIIIIIIILDCLRQYPMLLSSQSTGF